MEVDDSAGGGMGGTGGQVAARVGSRAAAAVGLCLACLLVPTAPAAAPAVADLASAPAAAAGHVARDGETVVTLDLNPRSTERGRPVTAVGQATLTAAGNPQPLPVEPVTLQRRHGRSWEVVARGTTDVEGRYRLTATPRGTDRTFRVVVAGNQVHAATASRAVPVAWRPAAVTLALVAPARPALGSSWTATATLATAEAVPPARAGLGVRFERRTAAGWAVVATARTDARGRATARLTTTTPLTLRAVVAGPDVVTAASPARAVAVGPPAPPVVAPAQAPRPARVVEDLPPAVGAGAHPVVSPLPDDLWTRMQGRTWQPGCTPRADLRLVEVNVVGFDGWPHRGQVVVHRDVAEAVAAVFTDLYAARYPIRSMVTEDRFGPDALGPGADDYASMAADNTSGFNCRYVVGQESEQVWSPHRTGRAIDVNPWENPFDARTGVFPDAWYLTNRPASDRAVIRPGDVVVRAFARHGFTWGGTWSGRDFQHFER